MPKKNKLTVYFQNNKVWDELDKLVSEKEKSVNKIIERLAKSECTKRLKSKFE